MPQPANFDEARVRDILRVLTRIPIPRGQLVLYHQALANTGAGFTSRQTRDILGFTLANHRGLMAALTNRINNTPRETSPTTKPGINLLFSARWGGDQNTYTAKPELLEAISRLPTLSAFLAKSSHEVGATPSFTVQLPADVPAKPPVSTPPPPTLAAPSDEPFYAFIRKLTAAGLVFPPELVANLLLALQVKRFVILTGISGTGKTKIGQTLASQYRPTQRIHATSPADDRSMVLQVRPYMRKHRRLTLPAALSSQIANVAGPGTIGVKWPAGEMVATTYRGDSLALSITGALKDWFLATLPEGASFILRLDGPDDSPNTIVFELPGPATTAPVENAEVIAVRPDWTDHRGLLGHYNPLSEQYVATPFLQLLLRAQDECKRAEEEKRAPAPFFALLDEMNLARVEHYFADFLSSLESTAPLHLHDQLHVEEGEGDQEQPVPRRLRIPPNVFFIGTVNVDESTYMFSPKVLDRAFAIELNTVDLNALATDVATGGDLDLVNWSGRLDPPTAPTRGDWQWLTEQRDGELAGLVQDAHAALARSNRHFGYRVATEVGRFVRLAVEQSGDPEAAAWAALDLAILQKVLVKLSGTQAELGELLTRLLEIALAGREEDPKLKDLARWKLDPVENAVTSADEADDREPIFPRSAAKLWRMRERLVQGFASWVE